MMMMMTRIAPLYKLCRCSRHFFYDVGICRPLLLSCLITFVYILVVVIALVININVITIFITDTIVYSRYHCSFISVDIVITVSIIITVSVIVSYHRYRHHHRDHFIFSLICMSDWFLLLFVSFRAGRYVTNSPASLAYRDVFVLTDDYNLHDEARNVAGNVMSPASGVVRGLRRAQIPVCVLEWRDRAGVVGE